jgi:dolichyl-phosphate-mannose-protein mannosyltransferase
MTETGPAEIEAAPATTLAVRSESWISILTKLIYPVALLASLSIWFLAIRAPLWLDETLAYWQVSGGFGKVWSRSALMPSSIGYLYTLWFAKSILGSQEIALKIPSTLAMLGAVYFLFRIARELYDQETAYLASIFFALTYNVVFAATDARPYAFALLASNIAIFAFVRWMRQRQMRQAILFGAAAAGILYFHYLFGALLPVFAIYYLVARGRSIKADWRQLAAVLASFTLFSLPLIYRVASLYHTRETHVVQKFTHPVLLTLNTLAPLQVVIGFVITAFLAALVRKIKLPGRDSFPAILLGPLLALVPAGVFFAVSAVLPVHLVVPRYLTVIAPGSALTWALLTRQIDSRVLRQIFCGGLVGLTVFQCFTSPASLEHELNFKQAHAFVNANISKDKDKVPVLVCSAFIESYFEPLPTDRSSENALLSQVGYYPIDAPVVMLPMDLNDETVRIASQTVLAAAQKRQRFLLVTGPTSYPTAEWLAEYSRGAFTSRLLREFDREIMVVEFRPVGNQGQDPGQTAAGEGNP